MPTKQQQYYLDNKEEFSRKAKDNYELKKDEYKRRAWKNHLKRDYGLTEQEYEQIWINQCGLCPICNTPLIKGKKTHLDHDHKTDKIRGILCNDCNMGLGRFKDDIVLLKRAIEYLGEGNGS